MFNMFVQWCARIEYIHFNDKIFTIGLLKKYFLKANVYIEYLTVGRSLSCILNLLFADLNTSHIRLLL